MPDVESPQPSVPVPPPQTSPRHLPVVAVWVRDLLVSLAIFLYQPVKVEGTSMMPGLEDQERIFVNKFVYRWEPIARGDIVVFRYPRDTSKTTTFASTTDKSTSTATLSKKTTFRPTTPTPVPIQRSPSQRIRSSSSATIAPCPTTAATSDRSTNASSTAKPGPGPRIAVFVRRDNQATIEFRVTFPYFLAWALLRGLEATRYFPSSSLIGSRSSDIVAAPP